MVAPNDDVLDTVAVLFKFDLTESSVVVKPGESRKVFSWNTWSVLPKSKTISVSRVSDYQNLASFLSYFVKSISLFFENVDVQV